MSQKKTVRQKVVIDIINEAWKDDDYKAKLVASPKKAIKELTGYDCSADAKIVVVDQTDRSFVHINIPAKPQFDNMELTDEQLEMVAGGEVWAITAGAVTAAAVSAGVGITLN